MPSSSPFSSSSSRFFTSSPSPHPWCSRRRHCHPSSTDIPPFYANFPLLLLLLLLLLSPFRAIFPLFMVFSRNQPAMPPLLFLLLLANARPSLGNLIFHQMEFDGDCMKAMCLADSGCIQHGCARDIFDRMGCGYFRMNIWQFKQCYEPGRNIGEESESAWIRCSEDFECASKCIVQVASRFRLKCYGKSDCETIARIHDGGANGCRTGETLPYWSSVKTFCPDC